MKLAAGSEVLVTGGAGFLGSHLSEALVGFGCRVVIIDNLSAGRWANLERIAGQVEVHQLNLASDDLRPVFDSHRFETVFHLAGQVDIPYSVRHPRTDLEANAGSSLGVLQALREAAEPPSLIHVSSGAIYGDGSGIPSQEDDSPQPVSHYAVSKLAAENYVAVSARLFGFPSAIVRLFPIYGPRQRRQVVYDLIRKIHANPNEIEVYGDGTQVRDFNFVTNVVDALVLITRQGHLGGEAYNVAGDEPTTIGGLVSQLVKALKADPKINYTGDVRKGDGQRLVANTDRLRAMGYAPKVALAEGLDETVAWYLEEAGGSTPC